MFSVNLTDTNASLHKDERKAIFNFKTVNVPASLIQDSFLAISLQASWKRGRGDQSGDKVNNTQESNQTRTSNPGLRQRRGVLIRTRPRRGSEQQWLVSSKGRQEQPAGHRRSCQPVARPEPQTRAECAGA